MRGCGQARRLFLGRLSNRRTRAPLSVPFLVVCSSYSTSCSSCAPLTVPLLRCVLLLLYLFQLGAPLSAPLIRGVLFLQCPFFVVCSSCCTFFRCVLLFQYLFLVCASLNCTPSASFWLLLLYHGAAVYVPFFVGVRVPVIPPKVRLGRVLPTSGRVCRHKEGKGARHLAHQTDILRIT